MMRNLTHQLARMYRHLDDDTLGVTQFQPSLINTTVS